MKVYILTCDKYIHITQAHMKLLNKYWPGQKVTILGYKEPQFELHEDFNFISMGEDKNWSDGLLKYFNSVNDKYFVILIDDLVPKSKINNDKILFLEKELIKRNADKAMLHSGHNYRNDNKQLNKNLLEIGPHNYRLTLHPAIWTKNFFLKYLKPNMNPWQFELENDNAAKKNSLIISYNDNEHIIDCINLYKQEMINSGGLHSNTLRNGKIIQHGFAKEDLDMIKKYLIKI